MIGQSQRSKDAGRHVKWRENLTKAVSGRKCCHDFPTLER